MNKTQTVSLLTLSVLLIFGGGAKAASPSTWSNAPSSTNWNNSADWNSGNTPVPGIAYVLSFGASTKSGLTNDFTAGSAFSVIGFTVGGAVYTMSGNSIALNNGITNASANTNTLNMDFSLSAANLWGNSVAGGKLVANGNISGAYALTLGGVGGVTLNGSNSFSSLVLGSTAIAGSGTVTIGTTNGIGTNANISGASSVANLQYLLFASNGTYTANNFTGQNFSMTGQGQSTTILSFTNIGTGSTNANAAAKTWTVTNSTVVFNGVTDLTRTANATVTLNGNNASISFLGAVTNSGAYTETITAALASGTLTLAQSNTISGFYSTGLNTTLAVSNSFAFGAPSISALGITNNTTILSLAADLFLSNAITIGSYTLNINNGGFKYTNASVITGTGTTLTYLGSGTTWLINNSTGISVTSIAGTVNAQSTNSLGSNTALTLSANSTLNINAAQTNKTYTVGTGANLNINVDNVALGASTNNGTITMTGGSVTINASTGTGAYTVGDGTTRASVTIGGVSPTIGAFTAGNKTDFAINTANGGLVSGGTVTLNSAGTTNDVITLNGAAPSNNFALLTGSSLTGTAISGKYISLTGSAIGGNTIYLGGAASPAVGRTTYSLTNNSTSMYIVTGGGAWNLNWIGGASGTWDYTTTGVWQSNNGVTASTFYAGDNANFTNGANTTITIAAGGIQANNTTLTIPSSYTTTITANAITNSGSINNTGAGNAVIASAIAGGSVIQSGLGAMTLSSINTQAGTTVSNGKLTIGTNTALGSGTVSLSGGILDLGGLSATSGDYTMTGGTLSNGTITAANYFLNGGTLSSNAVLGAGIASFGNNATTTVSAATNLSSTTWNIASGATLQYGNSSILPSSSYTYNSAAGSTLALNGYSQIFTNISGSGTITTGVGTLTLNIASNQAYTGIINIGAGGVVSVADNATANYNLSNSFIGSGTLNVALSTKNVGLTKDSSSFTGTTVISNAVASFSQTNSSGITAAFGSGTITSAPGATSSKVQWGGAANKSVEVDNPILISGVNDNLKFVPSTGSTLTLGGVISGSGTLSIGTGGSLVINNTANTYSGGTVETKGIITIGSAAALGTGPFTFDITTDGTTNGILSVTNTTTLTNTINIGRVTNSGGAFYTGEINVSSSKTFTVSGNIIQATNSVYSTNTDTGSNGLTKSGTGTLVLSGTNNYLGATIVSAGTLALNATNTATAVTINSGATLAGHGGSVGDVTINGALNLDLVSQVNGLLTMKSLTLNAGSTTTLDVENINQAPGTGYDRIVINGGALAYNGTLNITSTQTLAALFGGGVVQSVVLFSGMSTPTGDLASVTFNAGSSWTETSTSSGVFTYTDGNNYTYTFTDATGTLAIPEPGTCAMVGLGLSALAVTIIRRRRSND